MRLLVTGGAGFIGSHFVDLAVRLGHDVMVVDCLNYAGSRDNLNPRAAFVLADIRDGLAIEQAFAGFRPQGVMHLAAETHVTRSIVCRDEFLTTNVHGTHVLLEACLRHDVSRFVHVSTDEVYGSLGKYEKAWTEDSPYLPNNPYAASKAASDHLVRSYHKTFDLDVIITHAANNYGTRQHPEKLIPILIRQAIEGHKLTLHGDGLHTRDWIHVSDHVRGLILALERGCAGETYNFPGNDEWANHEIAKIVAEACDREINADLIELIPDRPGNDRRYAMTREKALNQLGFLSAHRIASDLAHTVGWYQENPNYASNYGR